jgi:hypothetical protein
VSCLLSVPVGDVVVFEVDRGEVPDDLVLVSVGPGKVATRTHTMLEEALANLKPSLVKVVGVLRETTVEFGMKVG